MKGEGGDGRGGLGKGGRRKKGEKKKTKERDVKDKHHQLWSSAKPCVKGMLVSAFKSKARTRGYHQ